MIYYNFLLKDACIAISTECCNELIYILKAICFNFYVLKLLIRENKKLYN